ncbi:MAG: efflux RND transporter periplasmic adaptor subunit [Deltaproteobacteria bacterium]|nr:efflux RND transporter periplasmic adaptor subunit [Deltaproteobacteria bacterium]
MHGPLKVSYRNPWAQVAVILLLVWIIAGCSKENEFVEPPPPKVSVAQPVQQDVTNYLEFTGITRAFEEAEVRARVSGFLESMHFTPGTDVEKGDLLFVIDPKEYQAEVNGAKAEVQSAKAQRQWAKIELARAKKLFEQKAGAEAEVVKWRGERDVAKAAVVRAEAKLERALLDLSYTKVTTPLTGRVSRNFEDIGNLVGEGEPTLLTTVTRREPMYVYFSLNERELLKVLAMYRQEIKEKGVDPAKEPARKAQIPLFLGLANEEGYPHKGTYDFAESTVDSGTATLQLRGVFPNPGNPPKLLPGLFTRLRMPIDVQKNAILVPDRALGLDQVGRYLLVVNKDKVVEQRYVKIGALVEGGMRVITDGLEADELVVVKGVQRAIPGAKVDPQQAEPGKTSRPVAKEETDGDNDLSQVDKLKEKVTVLQTQLSDIQAELDSTVDSKTQP